MPKFKKGDKVVANDLAARYCTVTIPGWTGTVTVGSTSDSDPWITVRGYDERFDTIGEFMVRKEYFDLCQKKPMTERWVRCPGCQHKLFMATDLDENSNALIKIKCHSCKNIIKVKINAGWITQEVDS